MSERAEQLRSEFDLAFQEQPRAVRAAQEQLLLIRAGSRTYGLRLATVDGIVRDKKVTPVPGSPFEQVGIVGLRGVLVTVFGLAQLIDDKPDQTDSWLALIGGSEQAKVALAFEALEGQLSLDPSALIASSQGSLFEAVVTRESGPLPVLSVAGLLQRIELITQRSS